MTLRPRSLALAACLCWTLSGAAAPLWAAGRSPYSLTVLVNGVAAPEYSSRGRVYIEALKGRNFSLLLENGTSEHVAVALSVDGRNVIDAKHTSAGEASKWILGPGQTAEIPGWQISGSVARQFYFTETQRSYARWLGDTSNAGTIEAVFYRERRPVVAAAPPYPPATRQRPRRESGADDRPSPEMQAPPEAAADAGSVQGGIESGASGSSSEQVVVSGEAPVIDSRRAQAPEARSDKDARGNALSSPSAKAKAQETDSFAATGIGARTSFGVQWVRFDEDPSPAARVALRYEFRAELVRLGVLRSRAEDDLYARDRGRGFEREYAPDPYRDR